MKTLSLILIFALPGFFLGDSIGDAPKSLDDPLVVLTVDYNLSSAQTHEVPLSQLEALTDQIFSAPDANQITTCRYKLKNGDCSTGTMDSCEEAKLKFWTCAECEQGLTAPPEFDIVCN